MLQLTETITKCLDFFGIQTKVSQVPFSLSRNIPRGRGVYVITDDTDVIYVGKGSIRDRQPKHLQKALNELKPGTRDTKGWSWLRENCDVIVNDWTIYYIILDKETELSAMEGALMHLLKPLANDETLSDRLKSSL